METTLLSFHGTTEEENNIVSPETISTALCVQTAILDNAENCSH
jgi:hypothetical protein